MTRCPQGQSDATKPKQKALAGFIAAHSNIVETIQAKHSWAKEYFYIETNAGSGWNDEVNCEGSPLVACRILSGQASLRHRCVFIEKDLERANSLKEILAKQCRKATVINNDHAIALPGVRVPSGSFGLVYADPNALKDAPVEALRAFFDQVNTGKLDVLYNLDAHQRRRVVAGQRKGGNPGNYDNLEGLMRRIPKKYWWIRQPFICAGAKWTFLFGSNYPALKIKGLGKIDLPLFPVKSADGNKIMIELMGNDRLGKQSSSSSSYSTYREYLAHPLFLSVRSEVMNRSGGICELCHERKAEEVHHRIYPAWGTFDESEALVAICHACHCKAHGTTK